MKPVQTPEANLTLTHPSGNRDQDLHVVRGMLYDHATGQTEQDARLGFVSTWMPDEQEAARLEAGGAIELALYGTNHPPVSLSVTPGVLPEREMISRAHVDAALGHLYGQIAHRIRQAIHQIQRDEIPASELVDAAGNVNPEAVGLPDPQTVAELWLDAVVSTHADGTTSLPITANGSIEIETDQQTGAKLIRNLTDPNSTIPTDLEDAWEDGTPQ